MVFKKLKKAKDVPLPEPETPVKQIDSRVGLDTYRDFYTLKNYWKTVDRNKKHAAGLLFSGYLKAHPHQIARYPKLKTLDADSLSAECSHTGFEAMAAEYLKAFDEVISAVEENPGDVSSACDRLKVIGKIHRTKVSGMKFDEFSQMEVPFLHMVSEVLQDRYNDKAENLFRKFFQFCLKYIIEGFNG